jgi:hypothetical protein
MELKLVKKYGLHIYNDRWVIKNSFEFLKRPGLIFDNVEIPHGRKFKS